MRSAPLGAEKILGLALEGPRPVDDDDARIHTGFSGGYPAHIRHYADTFRMCKKVLTASDGILQSKILQTAVRGRIHLLFQESFFFQPKNEIFLEEFQKRPFFLLAPLL